MARTDTPGNRPSAARHSEKRIYTVSELTDRIRSLVEEAFPFVWLTGEVSNFSAPASGHFYFTLKDTDAQIRGVMFRSQNRHLKFVPEDGMSITGMGRIGLYPPRGTYQIIFEYLEPRGLGALQAAFEQLKERLAGEGLFDASRKRPLPFLPGRIGVITSPTGSVIHDILRIALRRFPNLGIRIVPAAVQGDTAAAELVAAIETAGRLELDVAILARGGGSLEDLHAFNTESVARAIAASTVPIVSAVGHETDYTIADFVADLRAPTPSAAAELVVPVRQELERHCRDMVRALSRAIGVHMEGARTALADVSGRLGRVHPVRLLEDLRLRLDDTFGRMSRAQATRWRREQDRLRWITHRLNAQNPMTDINFFKEKIDIMEHNLMYYINNYTDHLRDRVRELDGVLRALHPEQILSRGYSITRLLPDGRIVRDARQVSDGDTVDIALARGGMVAVVQHRRDDTGGTDRTSENGRQGHGRQTDL